MRMMTIKMRTIRLETMRMKTIRMKTKRPGQYGRDNMGGTIRIRTI